MLLSEPQSSRPRQRSDEQAQATADQQEIEGGIDEHPSERQRAHPPEPFRLHERRHISTLAERHWWAETPRAAVSFVMLEGLLGFAYHPAVLAEAEERELAFRLEALDFAAVTMRGKVARRRTKHFGWVYGYESWRITPGPPIPDFLDPVRGRAARLAGVSPEDLVEVLVNAYPPGAGIGWHRDAPQFGVVVGVSLLGECRLRFQRGRGSARQTRAVTIAPRSAYVLDGEARYEWQHTVPPTKTLRYSVTFRTLQTRAGGVSPRVESAARAGDQSAKNDNDGDQRPRRQREHDAQEHADDRTDG